MNNSPVEKVKEYAELDAYSKAQTKTIIDLSKKLNEKDKEIQHLKKLLEGSVPLIKEPKDLINFEANDQEYICRTEILKLKEISRERELTLEETKKLDIFCKILKDITNAPKTIEVKSRKMSNEELMAAVTVEEANE